MSLDKTLARAAPQGRSRVSMSCCDWPTCASVLLPARRLFHRDWLARKRPLVSTGSRASAVAGHRPLPDRPPGPLRPSLQSPMQRHMQNMTYCCNSRQPLFRLLWSFWTQPSLSGSKQFIEASCTSTSSPLVACLALKART